jgi:hypothetical protein
MLLLPFIYILLGFIELVLLDGDTLLFNLVCHIFNNDPLGTGIPNILYCITALILAEIDRDYTYTPTHSYRR